MTPAQLFALHDGGVAMPGYSSAAELRQLASLGFA